MPPDEEHEISEPSLLISTLDRRARQGTVQNRLLALHRSRNAHKPSVLQTHPDTRTGRAAFTGRDSFEFRAGYERIPQWYGHRSHRSRNSRRQAHLTNEATGFKSDFVSDETGNYSFRNLTPGKYDLNASAGGFKTQDQKGIELPSTRRPASTCTCPSVRPAKPSPSSATPP